MSDLVFAVRYGATKNLRVKKTLNHRKLIERNGTCPDQLAVAI